MQPRPGSPPAPGPAVPARTGRDRECKICGTGFAATEGEGKGRVQSLEKADVTFVGRNDFIAVSIATSGVLERPGRRCEQARARARRGCPRAGAAGRAAGSERSLCALLASRRGNNGSKGQQSVLQASLKQAVSKQSPVLANTSETEPR